MTKRERRFIKKYTKTKAKYTKRWQNEVDRKNFKLVSRTAKRLYKRIAKKIDYVMSF